MEEGRPAYHRALLLKVWLYAYALGVTSARRLEQRVREDPAFRYLAAGAGPDFWTLNQFRTRHARAPERSVHTGGGVGAVAGNGAAGTRGHGLDAGGGQRLAGPGGDGGQVAGRASQNSAADSSLAETM